MSLTQEPAILFDNVGNFLSSFMVKQDVDMTQICPIFDDTTQRVTVKRDSERQFIEIDFEKLEIGQLHLVKYQGELYAVQRISRFEIAFYDVIQ